MLAVVVFGTQIAWFGLGNAEVAIREDSRLSDLSYWLFSALLIAAWMWSLSLIDSRSDRVIGTGSAEYIRIISVSIRLFGIIAILAFLLRVDVARGYLLISLPLGVLMLLLERWLWRQWLIRRRVRRVLRPRAPGGLRAIGRRRSVRLCIAIRAPDTTWSAPCSPGHEGGTVDGTTSRSWAASAACRPP